MPGSPPAGDRLRREAPPAGRSARGRAGAVRQGSAGGSRGPQLSRAPARERPLLPPEAVPAPGPHRAAAQPPPRRPLRRPKPRPRSLSEGPQPVPGDPQPVVQSETYPPGRRWRTDALPPASPAHPGTRCPVPRRPRIAVRPRPQPPVHPCGRVSRDRPCPRAQVPQPAGARLPLPAGPMPSDRAILDDLAGGARDGGWGRSFGPRMLPRVAPGRASRPAYRGGGASAKAVHNLGGPIPPAAAEG